MTERPSGARIGKTTGAARRLPEAPQGLEPEHGADEYRFLLLYGLNTSSRPLASVPGKLIQQPELDSTLKSFKQSELTCFFKPALSDSPPFFSVIVGVVE